MSAMERSIIVLLFRKKKTSPLVLVLRHNLKSINNYLSSSLFFENYRLWTLTRWKEGVVRRLCQQFKVYRSAEQRKWKFIFQAFVFESWSKKFTAWQRGLPSTRMQANLRFSTYQVLAGKFSVPAFQDPELLANTSRYSCFFLQYRVCVRRRVHRWHENNILSLEVRPELNDSTEREYPYPRPIVMGVVVRVTHFRVIFMHRQDIVAAPTPSPVPS